MCGVSGWTQSHGLTHAVLYLHVHAALTHFIDQIKEGRVGHSGANEWRVHYTGFKASSDAWVTSDMIKSAPVSETRPTKKAKHA